MFLRQKASKVSRGVPPPPPFASVRFWIGPVLTVDSYNAHTKEPRLLHPFFPFATDFFISAPGFVFNTRSHGIGRHAALSLSPGNPQASLALKVNCTPLLLSPQVTSPFYFFVLPFGEGDPEYPAAPVVFPKYSPSGDDSATHGVFFLSLFGGLKTKIP